MCSLVISASLIRLSVICLLLFSKTPGKGANNENNSTIRQHCCGNFEASIYVVSGWMDGVMTKANAAEITMAVQTNWATLRHTDVTAWSLRCFTIQSASYILPVFYTLSLCLAPDHPHFIHSPSCTLQRNGRNCTEQLLEVELSHQNQSLS